MKNLLESGLNVSTSVGALNNPFTDNAERPMALTFYEHDGLPGDLKLAQKTNSVGQENIGSGKKQGVFRLPIDARIWERIPSRQELINVGCCH